MKALWSLVASIVVLMLLSTDAGAVRSVRDFSGDAMQSYSSRMLDSPMLRIPTLLGTTFWPFLPYSPSPNDDVPGSPAPNARDGSCAATANTSLACEILDTAVWNLCRTRGKFDNEPDGRGAETLPLVTSDAPERRHTGRSA